MLYVCFVVSDCRLHVLPNTRFHVVLRLFFRVIPLLTFCTIGLQGSIVINISYYFVHYSVEKMIIGRMLNLIQPKK